MCPPQIYRDYKIVRLSERILVLQLLRNLEELGILRGEAHLRQHNTRGWYKATYYRSTQLKRFLADRDIVAIARELSRTGTIDGRPVVRPAMIIGKFD